MKNSNRPDLQSRARTLALVLVSAFAVAGCGDESPTAPGGFTQSTDDWSMLVDDTHGAVNDLTKHQLNDLVEYLRSL